jgi:histidinol-phosphate aminotransferase
MASGSGALTTADIQGWGEAPGVINIGNNENPWGPSPAAIRAIADDMMNLNRYDWQAVRALERAIAKYHRIPDPPPRENPWGPSGYPILTESGSGFILRLIALNYGIQNGTGEVIEADPSYGSVSRTAVSYGRQFGTEVSSVRVPLTEDYKHDLDAMLAAISDRTTLVVITNPNNPTGTLIPQSEIEAFVSAVPKRVTVFIDEAYIHFNRVQGNEGSVEIALNSENVIVSRTFSKIFGLAGLRVGYAVAGSDMIKRLQVFGNSGGIGRINAKAATAALGDNSFVRSVKRKTNDGKAYFYGEMEKLGLEYIPSHSSFVLVNIEQDGAALAERMRERNVILSRLGVTGNPQYSNYVRFSIGTLEELEVAISVFKEELAA